MASTLRQQRIEEYLKREIGMLLHTEMSDPRIGFVSVTAVKVSKDLKVARVSVSVMGEKKDKSRTMSALRQAKGFVQSHVGRVSELRSVPEVIFELDESIERAARISKIIDDARADDQQAALERGEDEDGEGEGE